MGKVRGTEGKTCSEEKDFNGEGKGDEYEEDTEVDAEKDDA